MLKTHNDTETDGQTDPPAETSATEAVQDEERRGGGAWCCRGGVSCCRGGASHCMGRSLLPWGLLLQAADFGMEPNMFLFLKPEDDDSRPVFLRSLERA